MAKNINPKLQKNVFFDINKFPEDWGILMFPISMSKVNTSQNPKNLVNFIKLFSKKVSKAQVGINFIYTDSLYLNSDEKASVLKDKYMNSISNHKNALDKLISKNKIEFQIQHAFQYMTWNQLYLSSNKFIEFLRELKNIYKKDKVFQKYVKEDCLAMNRQTDKNQVNFVLEEILILHLIMGGESILPNDYVLHREKWILFCYPGKPLKSFVYLSQLNPFKLSNSSNPYQNTQYDLETKQLIEFDRVDLDTYSPK